MPRALIALCLGLLALRPTLVSQSQSSSPAPAMPGYTPARAGAQREVERALQQLPSAQRITEWHRYFTAEPHPATSPRTKAIAERIAQAWKEQGLEDVTIRRYDVLSSNPREVRVEMVSPRRYVPSLKEDAYREDPDTSHKDISRSWLSFSASGDVTAPVVYANSGNPRTTIGCAPRASIRKARLSSSATRTHTATVASRRSPPSVKARPGSSSTPTRWRTASRRGRCSRRDPGGRIATSSAAASPTTTSSPAIR